MSGPVFARHQTFHPRYGWLKKGFDAASENPEIFLDPDAHVRLGVGKNMVRSIRYWCHAFKLLEEYSEKTKSVTGSRPSKFGKFLLGSRGVDQYLEHLGSLWLLHWKLLSEPCLATAWWYAFFVYAKPELSLDALTAGLREYVNRNFPRSRAAESSLRKDASCIIRMYGDLPRGAAVSEESIHCPFAELGLVRATGVPRAYAFRMGSKPGLSSQLIAASCLEYAGNLNSGAQTISLIRLLYDPGSPGLAFRLSEGILSAALEEVAEANPSIGLSDSGGIVQLSFTEPALELCRRLILEHYQQMSRVEVFI